MSIVNMYLEISNSFNQVEKLGLNVAFKKFNTIIMGGRGGRGDYYVYNRAHYTWVDE